LQDMGDSLMEFGCWLLASRNKVREVKVSPPVDCRNFSYILLCNSVMTRHELMASRGASLCLLSHITSCLHAARQEL
jgi:hypothetical protein